MGIWSSEFSATAAAEPLSPADALKAFDTEPGLRVELAAAEPLTASPCALAWDERGRLFVAENRGYPLGGPNGSAVGVVALLEDTDGDGRMDKRTEFATGLTFPNGLMPWRGGLIVTCAPDVFYFKDTNGDGQADVKEVLLTGFATNASTQLRVNAPLLGPDGWVYLASGLSGGKITSPKRPQQPVLDMKGDLRFRPDTGEFANADGRSQFGQSFDDMGRRFGVFNRVQVQHFVVPSEIIARNPNVNSPGVLQNCPELVVNKLMRGEGAAARLFPISANITTADSHAGFFTAACAVHIYRGDALPAEYYGHAFSCDPTGNLVHHDALEMTGPTFAAKRVRDGVEFMRSRDGWFRPVFLATGPDGALYVADMYRGTIEHPEYLPEEVRKRTDFDGGKTMGRIWKITRTDFKKPAFKFEHDSTAGLLRELSATNGWRRDTAFRLMAERRPKEALPALMGVFTNLPSLDDRFAYLPRATNDPAGPGPHVMRALALSTLTLVSDWDEQIFTKDGTGKSTSSLGSASANELATLLIRATLDRSPGVREIAWRMLGVLPSDGPEIGGEWLRLWAVDPNPRARLQCALTLGGWNWSETLQPLARVALRDGDNRWSRAAVLCGLVGSEHPAGGFLDYLIEDASNQPAPAMTAELGRLMGKAEDAETLRELGSRRRLWPNGAGVQWKLAFWAGAAEAVRTRRDHDPVTPLNDSLGLRAEQMKTLRVLALETLQERARPLDHRQYALAYLRQFGTGEEREKLLALIDAREPLELQTLLAQTLVQSSALNSTREILAEPFWKRLSPALRTIVLTTLLTQPTSWPTLLDALEAGALASGALNSNQRAQLKQAKDEAVRQRAEKLFGSAGVGNRQQALTEAKTCLALKPAPANGREVFKRLCASCHRLEREGVGVGPDLFDVRNQSKETLLLHIVIPEYEIAPNFANYLCTTKDGRAVNGIMVEDSSSGVTLRQAQGLEEKISRANIASLATSPLSLMPQEMEKTMSAQELADLLAYLRGEK